MNYHLSRNGKNEGIFLLEDLRKRRASGELTGAELVWREGMAGWQALDIVLQEIPSPPALPQKPRKSKTVPIILFSLVGVLAIAVLAVVIIKLSKSASELLTSGVLNPNLNRSAAMTAASKPVASSKTSTTQKEVTKQSGEFRRRQWLEGYKQQGQRDPSYDADALLLIENWIALNFGGEVNTNVASQAELSDRLVANPALKDPVVLTVAALNAVELHEGVTRLERALVEFESSKHKGYVEFYATVTLAGKLITKKSDRMPVLDAAALRAFGEGFKDGSLVPGDQAELAEILVKGWAKGFFGRNRKAVIRVIEEQGEPFAWLALVMAGEAEIDWAWNARGSGFSDTVSAKGWEDFQTHLANAREKLTAAAKLRPDLPMAPTRMIYVSLGAGDITEMRRWFDRAVAAQIDYPSAWADLRWGLRPRWYGDLDSMLALGVTAVNTKRFDTDVPRMLFDVVSDLESELELPQGEHIYGREDIWPSLRTMYEGYIAEPSQSEHRDGWRRTFAVVSYFGGKFEVAAEQLQAVNWQWEPGSFYSWGKDLSLMPLEVAARTGKLGKRVADAESFREREDFSKALEIYSELAARKDADERTRAFIEDRLATLKIEQQLQSGNWVDFLPTTKNLAGWTMTRGKSELLSDGALEIKADANGHLLYSRARVGMNFEARGTLETVQSSTRSFQGGLVMGLPEYQSYSWNAFRIKRNQHEGDVSSFSQHWTTRQIVSPIKVDEKTNSFVLQCQDGKVSASVNDVEIFKEVLPPKNSYLATNEFFSGLALSMT